MVSYCCVKGCSSNSNNKKKDPSSMLSFHAFPSNPEQKTKWLKAIGRPIWVPPSHARICNRHFNQDHINYEGCRIRIKDDTIPTNNLPLNSNFEATNVEVCRICLATDLKLYSVLDSQLTSYMDSVAGLNENYNIEGLPQYICYECLACLIRCHKLIEKSMTAQATLLDIFARNGQITKSLIKEQNRDKLNLTSSLSYCVPNTYYYYKNNEENSTYSTDYIDNNTCFKNENVENYVHLKSDTEIEINKYKIEIIQSKLNEEINRNDKTNYLEASYIEESPDSDSISDNDIHKTEEEIVESNNIKSERKKRVSKENLLKKKTIRKTTKDLTPDELDMQKYFDIIDLTLQEQKHEWKRIVARRQLNSETVHECEVCGKKFSHVNSYKVHASSHDSSRGKLECPVCRLRFKSDILVKYHVKRAHSKKFYCKACTKVFNNVLVAKKHQRRHAGYTYKCTECPFTSVHESVVGEHNRRAHAVLACALCGRACRSRRGLRLHAYSAHGRAEEEADINKPYPCETCEINFASEGARRVHLLTSSQHRKGPSLLVPVTENLRNSCRKCGVECASLKELADHTRAEHPRTDQRKWRTQDSYPKQCQLCTETMTCRLKHRQHVRRQHPKEADTYRPVVTAVCDICGKGFQNSTKLHLHQLRHREPTVTCDICPRLFYDKYALARHATTHASSKPYECRTCGRSFKLRSNLERHSRVHTDIAPYECTMCGKKFKYSTSLNLHIRTIHYKLPHPPRKKRNKSNKDTEACANNRNP